jgi:hypothetical protein
MKRNSYFFISSILVNLQFNAINLRTPLKIFSAPISSLSVGHLKIQHNELLLVQKNEGARVNFWAKFREAVIQFHHRFACAPSKKPPLFFAAKPPNCDQSSAISIHGRSVYNRPRTQYNTQNNTRQIQMKSSLSSLLSYAIPDAGWRVKRLLGNGTWKKTKPTGSSHTRSSARTRDVFRASLSFNRSLLAIGKRFYCVKDRVRCRMCIACYFITCLALWPDMFDAVLHLG